MNPTHTYEVILTARCKVKIEAVSPQAASVAAQQHAELRTWSDVRVRDVQLQLKQAHSFCGARQRDDFGRTDLEEIPDLHELDELKRAA